MTDSVAPPVVELSWETSGVASAATGVRGATEGSPLATVWVGAGSRAWPVTNLFKLSQLAGGLTVGLSDSGAVEGTFAKEGAVEPRAVGCVGVYGEPGLPRYS